MNYVIILQVGIGYMNYNIEMHKQLDSIEDGTRLLLHACCAPCSSAVLEKLANHFEITIYFYYSSYFLFKQSKIKEIAS